MSRKFKVLLVGGGTGGHIYPLVAVGEELKKRGIDFIFVGGKGKEEEIVSAYKWPFFAITSGKIRRYLNIKAFFLNIIDLAKIKIGFWQSLWILIKYRPNVVFSKGGYVSLPMIFAARLCGRRIIIHESDAVMGAANRFAAGFASCVMTGFETEVYDNKNSRFMRVGIPIRSSLANSQKLKAPQKHRSLILVIGGSQGATPINNLIEKSLEKLLKIADVVHVTGEKDYLRFKEIKMKYGEAYKVFGYLDRELSYYLQTADLIIARASSMFAEAALFSKPVYLIPLPHAAQNHQLVNARVLEKKGAAVVGEEASLTPDILYNDIEAILKDKVKLDELGKNLNRYFAEDETLEKIINEIEKNG